MKRAAYWLLVLAGVLALAAAVLATPERLASLSGDGTVSKALIEKVRWLRLWAGLGGGFSLVIAVWIRFRTIAAMVVLAAVVVWAGSFTKKLYPHNLLSQPMQLARAALGDEMLLSQFDPQAKLVTPAHEVLRAKFPVINIHAHFRRWYQHWSPDALIQMMGECNVQHIVDLDGELAKSLRKEVETWSQPHPDKFTTLATFWFPDGKIDWNYFQQSVKDLDEAKSLGAKGIKIWKNIGLRTLDETGKIIPVDDPRLDPLWAKAGEHKLFFLIHVGDPAAFFDPTDRHNERYEELQANPDWAFNDPGTPPLGSILSQLERVMQRFPQVTFIVAHLGNRTDDLREAAGILDRNPNAYMDISARLSELGRQPRAAREFFISYQDRLLFGTDGNPDASAYRVYFRFLETADEYFDYPFWPKFNYGRWKIYGVDLPDEVLRKLYHDNAAKILGLELLGGPAAP